MSDFCAVLAIKGNCPSRRVEYINPTRTLDIDATLSLFHLDSTTYTIDHLLAQALPSPLHTRTHYRTHKHLFNNVVLSIPEGRDQADSGRMLVSPGRSSDPLIILIDFSSRPQQMRHQVLPRLRLRSLFVPWTMHLRRVPEQEDRGGRL
jgi:hypothetical protein